MRKISESVKTLVIVLLVFLMLFLWTKNMQLRFSGSRSTNSDTPTLDSGLWIFTDSTNSHTEKSADPAYFSPLSITLVANFSAHTTATNKSLTQNIWETTKPLVKEVFSSTHECSASDSEAWSNALLKKDYTLVEFPSPLPYMTICAFDNKTSGFCSGEICAVKKLLLFSDENNIVCALAKDGNSNYFSFYASDDSASSAMIYDFNSNNLAAYTVNKDFISAKINVDKNLPVVLPDDHVFLEGTPLLQSIVVKNPVMELFEKLYAFEDMTNSSLISDLTLISLLEKFNINPSTAGVYTDAQSTLIFVNSDSRLTINKDGTVEYTLSQESEATVTNSWLLESERTQFSSFEQIAAATVFLNLFRGDFIGEDTELLLEKINYSGGKTTYTFGYYKSLCKLVNKKGSSEVVLTFDEKGLVNALITPIMTETSVLPASDTGLIKATVSEPLALSLIFPTDSASLVLEDFCPIYSYDEYSATIEPVWVSLT